MNSKRNLDQIRFKRVVDRFKPLLNSFLITERELVIIFTYLSHEDILYLVKWVKRNHYKIFISTYINTLFLSIKIYK